AKAVKVATIHATVETFGRDAASGALLALRPLTPLAEQLQLQCALAKAPLIGGSASAAPVLGSVRPGPGPFSPCSLRGFRARRPWCSTSASSRSGTREPAASSHSKRRSRAPSGPTGRP